MIKISVIILPCRHQEMIRESLSGQTLKEMEILEVPSGESPEKALAAARGKYVIFIDRAISAEPDALERICTFAEENDPDVTVAAADIHNICKDKYVPEKRFLNLGYFGGRNIISRGEYPEAVMNFTSPVSFNKMFRTDRVKESGLLKDGFNNAFFVYSMITSAEKTGGLDEVLFHCGMNFADGETEDITDPDTFIRDFEKLESYLLEKGIFEEFSHTFLKCFAAEFAYILRRSEEPGSAVELSRKVSLSPLFEKYGERLQGDYAGDENVSMLRSAPAIVKTYDAFFAPQDNEEPVLTAGEVPEKEVAVSVVIPAYNVGTYAGNCVRSVLGQSLKDIEVICIDDGSEDSTPDVLRKLAEEDKRVRVYSRPNGGISVARNNGLKLARGRYVYFLDSDDMIVPEALKELSDQMDRDGLDMLIFNYADCFSDDEGMETFVRNGQDFYRRNGVYPSKCDGVSLMSEMLKRNEYIPSIHGQIYRRSFLENIRAAFIPRLIHEDNIFTFMVLSSCQSCGYSEGRYYRRRYRSGSIMTSRVSFRNCYGYFISYIKCRDFTVSRGLEDREEINEAVIRLFDNTVASQMKLPPEERYFFYGLDRGLFRVYSRTVFRQAELRSKETALTERNAEVRTLAGEKRGLEAELKKAAGEKASLNSEILAGKEQIRILSTDLEKTRRSKAETENKLSDMTSQRDGLQGKLKAAGDLQVRLEKNINDLNKNKTDLEKRLKESDKVNSGLKGRIDELNAGKTELNTVLRRTYDEKSEINRKLQQTYKEKSELNRKLQQTYEEKSGINRKLKQAYEEKSEINRKLKITYEEKSERGLKIKEQKAEIEKLKRRNSELEEKIRKQKAEIDNLSEKISNKLIRKLKKLLKKR